MQVFAEQGVGFVLEEAAERLLAGGVEREVAPPGELRGEEGDAPAVEFGAPVGEPETRDEARKEAGVLDGIPGRYFRESSLAEERRTATKASCGTLTVPNCFIRFLPSFCLLSSFCLRVMSPP